MNIVELVESDDERLAREMEKFTSVGGIKGTQTELMMAQMVLVLSAIHGRLGEVMLLLDDRLGRLETEVFKERLA